MPLFNFHWIQYWKKHWVIGLVLLLGFTNGLLFVFLIPPWQHYDEPGQFEYAWLIANQKGLPKPGTYDQAMRRELAASMIEHDFFRGLDFKPNLLSANEPVWIGISQINKTPLYYWFVAWFLRLIRGADITFQLYLARLVSLLLYLIIILTSYGIMIELVPSGHPLRWMVPVSLALLASFTNLMTAVNDDVGATAVFSLFLWLSIRSIQRGFSWFYSLGLLILATIGFYTKNTIAFVILLVPLVLLFSLFRGARRWLAWIVLGIAAIIGLFFMFNWGDPAFWYLLSYQNNPTRILDPRAPRGSHVLALTYDTGIASPRIVQVIPETTSQELRGKKVTLGFWIWASEPLQINSPIIDDGINLYSQELVAGKDPSFFFFPAMVDKESKHLKIILSPQLSTKDSPITVYYDGLVLVEGDRSTNTFPEFNDLSGQQGNWGRMSFENAIRNASFELGWFKLRPWVEHLSIKYSPVPLSMLIASLIDWPVTKVYFLTAGQELYRTFWGRFGWGHVPLYGGKPYRLLLILTMAGLVGAVTWLLCRRTTLPGEILFLLGIALLFSWGATLMRGLTSIIGTAWIPSAHYASPVIVPTNLVLCAGWLGILRLFEKMTHISSKVLAYLFIMFLVWLEIYSISSIVIYYKVFFK